MFVFRHVALVLGCLCLAAPAFAQEGDLLDDDESALDNIDDLDTLQEDAPDLIEEPDGPTSDDDANTYRMAREEAEGLDPDEEQMVWEDYLLEYPNSAFKDRIERRIEELQRAQYQGGGEGPGGGKGPGNADSERINIAQALLLENIEPRTRIAAGFEWGLPDYLNFILDYEKAILPELSAHIGFHQRYTGPNIEGGVKYALIRSVRTQTLLTLLGDVRVNLGPAFVAIRPQVAFGKRIGKVDLQVQLGPDLSPRRAVISEQESKGKLDMRLVGGLNINYQASDQVALFLEAGMHMKNSQSYAYRFNTATFGMKFYPNVSKGRMEANLGASAPVAPNYWMYHYGSIMGQVNYYFEE